MKVDYSPQFYRQYKKANVRIRNRVDEKVAIFIENSEDFQLHNHPLKREYTGYHSINITADWRAIYKELEIGGEVVAYFVQLGTHKELYQTN